MRYHINGHFIEERKKGFAVHHQLEKSVSTFAELQDSYENFLSPYNPNFCYGLTLGYSEEPSLVNDES